jgi:hypothetical protein
MYVSAVKIDGASVYHCEPVLAVLAVEAGDPFITLVQAHSPYLARLVHYM